MKLKKPFHCVIVTGMSGAGRSHVLSALEDLGVSSVDNLPLQLLPSLADLYHESGVNLKEVAIGVDVRMGALLDEFTKSLLDLSRRGITYQIIFLEANDDVLIRRFSETRRRHPLGSTVSGGIREERQRVKVIRSLADKIIDTSRTTPNELKAIVSRTLHSKKKRDMAITVMSFGYKYGIPIDADVVLDVRFLPNPNYVPSMKELTGLNKKVSSYVLNNPITKKYLTHIKKMLQLTTPHYAKEGKSYLTVAVGCTGGQHRSVALAEAIRDFLTHRRFPTRLIHRDVPTKRI